QPRHDSLDRLGRFAFATRHFEYLLCAERRAHRGELLRAVGEDQGDEPEARQDADRAKIAVREHVRCVAVVPQAPLQAMGQLLAAREIAADEEQRRRALAEAREALCLRDATVA